MWLLINWFGADQLEPHRVATAAWYATECGHAPHNTIQLVCRRVYTNKAPLVVTSWPHGAVGESSS